MHYAKQLKSEIENQKAQIAEIRAGLKNLIMYCQSDKYAGVIRTMNPDDVVLRVDEIVDHVIDNYHP